MPDYTTVWVIGRFETTEEMLRSLARVDKCAQAGALATETTVEKEVITITHHKIPNKRPCRKVLQKSADHRSTSVHGRGT